MELRDNAETNRTPGQFALGAQSIDEPIAYSRDTDGDDKLNREMRVGRSHSEG
ncbi:MAG: hypothetical protein AB7Q17_08905 [Phycisphaerae bacterium]